MLPDDLVGWLFASNGLHNSGQSDLDLQSGWSIPNGVNVVGQPPPIFSEPSPHMIQMHHFPHHFMGSSASTHSPDQPYEQQSNGSGDGYHEFMLTEDLRQQMFAILSVSLPISKRASV